MRAGDAAETTRTWPCLLGGRQQQHRSPVDLLLRGDELMSIPPIINSLCTVVDNQCSAKPYRVGHDDTL